MYEAWLLLQIIPRATLPPMEPPGPISLLLCTFSEPANSDSSSSSYSCFLHLSCCFSCFFLLISATFLGFSFRASFSLYALPNACFLTTFARVIILPALAFLAFHFFNSSWNCFALKVDWAEAVLANEASWIPNSRAFNRSCPL